MSGLVGSRTQILMSNLVAVKTHGWSTRYKEECSINLVLRGDVNKVGKLSKVSWRSQFRLRGIAPMEAWLGNLDVGTCNAVIK